MSLTARTDLFAVASAISDCVCASLTNRAAEDKVLDADGVEIPWTGPCCVWPAGEVSWDSCCEGGGQSWVLMKDSYPTTSFPSRDSSGSGRCQDGHSLAVNFEIGVLRCVCFDLCDCTVKEQNAMAVMKDLQAVLRGLQCCLSFDQGCDFGWRFLGTESLGPLGGCGGSKVNIVVEVPMPCCGDI